MIKKMKISVLGAGAWGTTIANLLAHKGFDVLIWAREKSVKKSINEKNENKIFLKGIKLSKKLIATNNLSNISDSDIIINAIPTQYIRPTLKDIKIKENAIILSLSKGIEINTYERPSEILHDIFHKDVYVLSGPNFAVEISKKKPAATTIAGKDEKIRKILQEILKTEYLRVYENDDVIGTEIGGAVKNVIAIAAGMSDKLNLGHNTKAALITRGLNEIRKLGKKLGAKDITFLGLSGIGDLILTCNSNISRNYSLGYKIASGKEPLKTISEMKQIAEGAKTAKALYKLSKKLSIEMPISVEVYRVIYEGKSPQKALETLMTRKPKPEFL